MISQGRHKKKLYGSASKEWGEVKYRVIKEKDLFVKLIFSDGEVPISIELEGGGTGGG